MSTVVVATMFVRAGKEAEAEEALRELASATHAEAGCLSYALHRDPKEPRTLVFVERWTSTVALENHLHQPYVKGSTRGCSSGRRRSGCSSRCRRAIR